jgi:hypothetical protein
MLPSEISKAVVALARASTASRLKTRAFQAVAWRPLCTRYLVRGNRDQTRNSGAFNFGQPQPALSQRMPELERLNIDSVQPKPVFHEKTFLWK